MCWWLLYKAQGNRIFSDFFLFVVKCKGIIVAPIIHTPWPNSTFPTIFSFTPFSKHWQGGIYIETRTGFVVANTFFIANLEKEIISVSLQLWEQRIKIVSASHLSQSAAAKNFPTFGILICSVEMFSCQSSNEATSFLGLGSFNSSKLNEKSWLKKTLLSWSCIIFVYLKVWSTLRMILSVSSVTVYHSGAHWVETMGTQ